MSSTLPSWALYVSALRADLVPGERLARLRAAGGIADHPGEVADDDDDLVAEVLEVAQLLEHDRVSQVQVGRGRVEAQLDLERRRRSGGSARASRAARPRRRSRRRPGGCGPAARSTVDGPCSRLYNSNPWRETDAPNAPRSGAGAGSAGRSWPSLVLVLVGGPGRRPPPRSGCSRSCPRSLPSVTQLETLRAERGHQGLRRQRRAHHRVPRRAPHLRARSPRSPRRSARPSSPPRTRASTPTTAWIPMGIARAVYQNFRRGRIVEGGSTITQQLAKVLFLTPDKSLERKLKEAVLALELERRYSKDRILEMYLNQIYFGHGAFGVEAAARTFFGKSVVASSACPSARSWPACPRRPSTYSPFDHPEAAKRRRATVLARMVDVGALKPRRRPRRLAEARLGLIPPERRRTTGQYYLEYVQQQLEAQYGADLVFKGGMHVYTTLSPVMQVKAERVAARRAQGARVAPGRRGQGQDRRAARSGPEGALLTIDPQTGYIKAMVGGYDFFKSEFNRAVQARRQPGLGLQALRVPGRARVRARPRPAWWTTRRSSSRPAATASRGSPRTTTASSAGPSPTSRRSRSRSTWPRSRCSRRTGIRRTVDIARRLGVESPLGENLSIALGHVRPHAARDHLGLRRARQPGRRGCDPTAIRYVLDSQRKLLEENTPQSKQVVSPELAYVMTYMLRGHDRARHRRGGPGARAARRGQDRHHQRLLQRVVHRLHAAARHRGVGRLRPPAQPGQGRDRLARRGADLDHLHAGGAGRHARGGLPDPGAGGAGAGRPRTARRAACGR